MVPLYNANGLQVPTTQPLTATIVNDLNFVKGMDGAKNWSTKPNSRVVIFDQDDDIMYIVQTDIYNNKTIQRKRFYDEPEPKPEDMFVSKQEFSELKGEINNVQLAIQQLISATNDAAKSANISNASADEHAGSESKGNYKHVQRFKGKSKPVGNVEQSSGE